MAEFDLLIRGGTVVDGTRRPRFRGDVGIVAGRIAEVGRLPTHSARKVVEADGLVVAPGSVDLHTHYDAQVHWDPYCTIASWHGVTSVTVGNCGFGLAPVRTEDTDRAMLTLSRNEAIPLPTLKAALPFTWRTFSEWMDHLDRLPLGINLCHLAPIAPIVARAMGGFDAAKDHAPTDAERRHILALLGEALDAGAVGWGAQRQRPDSFTSFQRDHDGTPMVTDLLPDDLYLDLARALRDRADTFIQFAQSTATPTDMLAAMRRDFEFNVRLAQISGRPLLYNAVAAVDSEPELFRTQLGWIQEANDRGARVYAQGATARSPLVFTLEDWNLFDASPVWREATLGGVEERVASLSRPEVRQALRAEHDAGGANTGFFGSLEHFTLFHTSSPEFAPLVGKTVAGIAELRGAHVIEALLDVSLAEGLRTEWMTPVVNGNPDKTQALFESPWVIPGTSDGGAHVKFLAAGSYPTDLVTWLVRDTARMSLEEAHFRLAALPARIAGLQDRGTLVPGSAADIIVYDLDALGEGPMETVHDLPAGEWRRVRRAFGYHHVFVNGTSIFEGSRCTGETPGRLLRHGRG